MMPKAEPFAGEQAVAHMDPAELETIVSAALAAPAMVTDWQVTLLGGLDSSPMAGGVYKVAGTAVTPTHTSQKWSIAVKILRSPEGITMPDGTQITQAMAENQRHPGYWQREAFVAQSDLLSHLPAGLRAPRSLGVSQHSRRECWLWQEYLPTDPAWTWEDYHAAASRLGQWQAAGQNMPNYSWLCQEWLSGWVHGPVTNIFGIMDAMNSYQHPLLTAHLTSEERTALRQLWANRQTYLDRLAQLTQTFCHLDAHRGNLSWQNGDLALCDWAFTGAGALGEELAAFIGGTLLLDYVPLANADQLERVAFAGYIAGLRVAGWSGDEANIWEAYRCAMPLRYAHMSMASILRTVMQPEFVADWERKAGKPLTDILVQRARLIGFYLSRLEG